MEKGVSRATPDAIALDLFGEPPPPKWLDPGEELNLVGLPEAEAERQVLDTPPPADSPDQVAFFNLDALTVRTPEDEIRAQLAQDVLTPQAKMQQQYEQTTLRQLVIVVDAGEYRWLVERMGAVRAAAKAKSNSEALLWLLTHWHP